MKELIPVLRNLFEDTVQTIFRLGEDIPFESFTELDYLGKDITIELNPDDIMYQLTIMVPLLQGQEIKWGLNKLTDDGSSWDLVRTGSLDSLNDVESLVNDINDGKLLGDKNGERQVN